MYAEIYNFPWKINYAVSVFRILNINMSFMKIKYKRIFRLKMEGGEKHGNYWQF